jgi:maltooligosyltrehalose trehalohydrolase
VWNEDLHHASHVTLTARREAYFSDYTGSARELLACVKHGFLYQGQRSTWQKEPRGAPALDIDPSQRVTFLENHDQVANSGFGKRLVDLTDRARLRAMTALLLLGPGTPMLFQGQEFASSTPFLYFADHRDELARAVAQGRGEFLMQFPSLTGVKLDAPGADATFGKCVIDWSEREANEWAVRLHRDLIALRRSDPVLSRAASLRLDGAVLSEDAFLVRVFGEGAERLFLFNFGGDWAPRIIPEPLLAPPTDQGWRLLWSSEHPDYGGDGVRDPVDREGCWYMQGRAACVLASDD